MSEVQEQEVDDILSAGVNYETINRLVDWLAQGESLSEEERATLRIRVIQMLCDTARWYSAYQTLWRTEL